MSLPFKITQFNWLKKVALDHLEAVVAVPSCSDEHSSTVPSSQGQVELTRLLEQRFEELGAQVQVDQFANIIASYPGRGKGEHEAPIALMIHLDTAHGTEALPSLNQTPNWNGEAVSFERNPKLLVNTDHYPSLQQFSGHTIIHGFGDAPFGLDDKLGLTHLLSLANLLNGEGEVPEALQQLDLPPVWLIGRPDEEIGRDAALIGLAERLAEAGITRGYTIDGIEPFEVNVANFFAGKAVITVEQSSRSSLPVGLPLKLTLGGVNTHGATAHAEGHRGAIRWLAELWKDVKDSGIHLCSYEGSQDRECDGIVYVWAPDLASAARLRQAVAQRVEPHIPRGGSVLFEEWISEDDITSDLTLEHLVSWLANTLFDNTLPYPLLAEDSSGWEGYSHPAQLQLDQNSQTWTLAWRLRDFERAQLEERADWIERQLSGAEGLSTASFQWSKQYDNMSARLEAAPELVTWAVEGAKELGIEAKVMPIRGGTGVDPFLDRGVMVANLGTGYFSPESEKELTSLEFMVQHALWLVSLLNQSTLDPLASE